MLAQDEETVELRETFTSLQQEVEAKTKKLKKVSAAQSRSPCVLSRTSLLSSILSSFLLTSSADLFLRFA